MLTRSRELTLIARCVAADDREAFGILVEEYSESLRRFLSGLVGGDLALADDLAQESFLKAYLAVRSLRGITGFRTWLFRIAYNEFVSHRRRTRLSDPLENASGISDDPPEEEAVPSATLEEALSRLSDPQRAVVQLFYYEEFSVARISTVTGLTRAAVKSHLHRARQRLAALLEKYRY